MIFADANVILTYLIFFVMRGRDGRPVLVQRSNRGRVAAMLEAAIKSGDLAITDTAAAEASRNARKAVLSAAKDAGATGRQASRAAGEVRAKIAGLHRRFRIMDRTEYLKKAGDAYAGAWTDERMQGAIEVRRLVKEGRGKDASMPTPEKNEGDFTILSTVAYWAARGHNVQLLTFDQDFVAFTIAIREKLGVDIVDCGRLGR